MHTGVSRDIGIKIGRPKAMIDVRDELRRSLYCFRIIGVSSLVRERTYPEPSINDTGTDDHK